MNEKLKFLVAIKIPPRGLSKVWLVIASLVVVIGAQWIRPLPFSTTDDNWMYFLPLIKAHTDSLLHGHFLNVLWSLGSGWVPWENAQVGILYLPYHLANLIARVIGHPLALLEISAWIHICAAGLIVHAWAPTDRPEDERLGWAVLAMLASGPLLIGLNWHNYLSCYPWFLALAFLLQKAIAVPGGLVSRRDRLLIGGSSLCFFLSAHAQMYVLGIGILILWAFAETPGRSALRAFLPFLWAQLPALVPLIYLKLLSADGTPDWMGNREDPYFLLSHAQTLAGVLHGTIFGNLIQTKDFQLWANISWTGVGMFFSPALIILSIPVWKDRSWALGLFFIACLIFLGADSFPMIRYVGIGPLDGFRWTWKLCIFVGPLALVSLLPRFGGVISRGGSKVTGVLIALSCVVFLRGLSFEMWPSLAAAHPFGAERLAGETRRMATAVGLSQKNRIALLGPWDMAQPLPLPVLGLIGNAPILAGLETAHLYEPMEPAWVSRGHFGLSLPWRVTVPAQAVIEHSTEILEALRGIGVQAVITVSEEVSHLPGFMLYTDPLGRRLWVKLIPGALAGPYPSGSGSGLLMSRTQSGQLMVPGSEKPPSILTPRPISWQRTATGWLGQPNTFPVGWAIATLIISGFGFLGLVWEGWNRRGPSSTPLAPEPSQ